jgi:hypothetical protein
MKFCVCCQTSKPFSEFYRAGKYKEAIYYRPECKECLPEEEKLKRIERQKKYRSTDKYKNTRRKLKTSDNYKQKAKEYARRPEVKARRSYLANIRAKERYKIDELFRLKITMRARLYEILTRFKYPKRGSIFKYLGCDINALKAHLESQFKDNMSWNNYGEWHVDHIIPLASAKSEEELIALCHYTNLQPLWAIDNLKKSDKILI